MALPLELMMHICDILAEEDDVPTLRSCALLFSQLTNHCQSHVFAKIDLRLASNTESSLRRLSEILQVHAELGDHVKKLHLSVWSPSYFDDIDLRSVLSRCTKVSAFNLFCRGIAYESLSDAKSRVLEPILYSPFLTKIAMMGSEIPATIFFARCHDSLTDLEFSGAFPNETPPSSVTVLGAKTKFLRHLKAPLPIVWSLLQFKREDNTAIFDLSQLRVLSTSEMRETLAIRCLNAILRCTVSLDWLILRVRHADLPITGLFYSPLRCLITLRHINLELNIRCGSPEQILLPFSGLFDELRRFPADNVLEEVDIRITIVGAQTSIVSTDDWILLATVFTKELFPCLKTVTVRIFMGDEDDWSYVVAAELAKLRFSSLELHYDFMFILNHDGRLVHIECKKSSS